MIVNISGQVNQTKSSYFAVPKSNQEYEQDSGQHMNSLHSKLHQEADKIRKWKIQAELDLKDRVKKQIIFRIVGLLIHPHFNPNF